MLPFGSSVNSFGCSDSDLDMVIKLDESEPRDSRLAFHIKSGRDYRWNLGEICGIIRTFLPGCQNVASILHAKVPIIKYRQLFLGLDCDLSSSSA